MFEVCGSVCEGPLSFQSHGLHHHMHVVNSWQQIQSRKDYSQLQLRIPPEVIYIFLNMFSLATYTFVLILCILKFILIILRKHALSLEKKLLTMKKTVFIKLWTHTVSCSSLKYTLISLYLILILQPPSGVVKLSRSA